MSEHEATTAPFVEGFSSLSELPPTIQECRRQLLTSLVRDGAEFTGQEVAETYNLKQVSGTRYLRQVAERHDDIVYDRPLEHLGTQKGSVLRLKENAPRHQTEVEYER